MSENKRATTPWVDPDDAPDMSSVDPDLATWKIGKRVVTPKEGEVAMAKQMARGRPKSNSPKTAVKLRLDADVLAALRATGDGWQTRINETLRASLHLAGKV